MINFKRTVYIRVYRNKFLLKHIEYGISTTMSSTKGFTTKRLLVGEFSPAQECLKEGFKKLHEGRWFAPSPAVLIQPMEMIEDGLSEVEERALKELATGAGAREAIVWIGRELSDAEVVNKVKDKR